MKKKNIIIATGHELSRDERKNYAKEHPGSRLCFRLRYPNFPMYLQVILLIFALIVLWLQLSGIL